MKLEACQRESWSLNLHMLVIIGDPIQIQSHQDLTQIPFKSHSNPPFLGCPRGFSPHLGHVDVVRCIPGFARRVAAVRGEAEVGEEATLGAVLVIEEDAQNQAVLRLR